MRNLLYNRPKSTALISHTVRRSIYAGADGEMKQEESDSVLDHFLRHAAADGKGAGGSDGSREGEAWERCSLEVRLLSQVTEDGEELRLYSLAPGESAASRPIAE